jgi:hypothetical protein
VNDGAEPTRVTAVEVTGGSGPDFVLADNRCGSDLRHGAHCTLGVRFVPSGPGARSARLQVRAAGVRDPLVVILAGAGQPRPAGVARVRPLELLFAEQDVNTASPFMDLRLRNLATPGAVTTVIGPDGASFQAGAPTCRGPSGSATCTVRVRFVPLRAGPHAAVLLLRLPGPPCRSRFR